MDPKTFTAIDLTNKALIAKKGNRVATKVYELRKDNGESGKGINSRIINDAVKLNNDSKSQNMKLTEWVMIKEASYAGVQDTKEAPASFMEREFAYLYTNAKQD
jgi:hypothetical protein